MAYQQCTCVWQYPDSGRCYCWHTDDHHDDAGRCWANALDCPECSSTLWYRDTWGGIDVMHCRACGNWQPNQRRSA